MSFNTFKKAQNPHIQYLNFAKKKNFKKNKFFVQSPGILIFTTCYYTKTWSQFGIHNIINKH